MLEEVEPMLLSGPRCSFTNEEVTSVIVYSTMPVGKVVGEFTIETVLMDKPQLFGEKRVSIRGYQRRFLMSTLSDEIRLMLLKLEHCYRMTIR